MDSTTINVVVGKKKTIKVSTNATAGVINTSEPVTLKNIPTIHSGATTVETLTDVVATNEVTGDTLVYNAATKTWNAQEIDLLYVTGSLDAGIF